MKPLIALRTCICRRQRFDLDTMAAKIKQCCSSVASVLRPTIVFLPMSTTPVTSPPPLKLLRILCICCELTLSTVTMKIDLYLSRDQLLSRLYEWSG